MKVISLFDGMACGLTALKRADIKVSEYHAFEIDKYAIQIAKKNHPEIIHHGKISSETDFRQFEGVDLLIGGSPCQGFSFAGKQLAFDDPRSKLFFEYVRALNEISPKNFLLENVKMKKEYLDVMTDVLGVRPILINSALVSAQNRNRFYWCSWDVEQPMDRKIFLKDIIEQGVVDRDKSYCIDANYFKGGNLKSYFEKGRRQLVFKIGNIGKGNYQSNRVYSIKGKSTTLNSGGGGGAKTGLYEIENNYRKLTPIECERLQNLPDLYTEGVSNSQRYKMIGNGWTVDVVSHLFKALTKATGEV